MNNIKNGSKITFEKVYFFIVFLYAARATIFTTVIDFRLNPIGFALLFLPAIYLCQKYKLAISKGKIAVVFAILTAWMAIHFLIDVKFDIFTYYVVYVQLFVGYVVLNVFKDKIFLYYENITVALSFVALLLWSIMQVVGVPAVASLGFMQPSSSISSASLLIFNTPQISDYDGYLLGLTRNCGFAWEPGLFACFLALAIYFNLIRTHKIIGNKNLYVLIAAMISTSSTTGYFLLFILMFNYYIFQVAKSHYKILALIFLIPVAIWGSHLPFMGDKIKQTSSAENFISENSTHLNYLDNEGFSMTVQRFEGIYLEFLNFKDAPVFGYGSKGNSYMNTQISPHLVVSSGVITAFSQFGLIIGILITLVYIKSAKKFDERYNQKYLMLFVIYIFMSISYNFNLIALFIAIMWSGFLLDKRQTLYSLNIAKS